VSLETDDAMSEVVPPESMDSGDWAHVRRVVNQHTTLVERKYSAGKSEHLGSCWLKPGMLAHALDESADLTVYLWTLREQIQHLAADLRAGGITSGDAADALDRLLKP
jgi:hypothetical protein